MTPGEIKMDEMQHRQLLAASYAADHADNGRPYVRKSRREFDGRAYDHCVSSRTADYIDRAERAARNAEDVDRVPRERAPRPIGARLADGYELLSMVGDEKYD